MKENNAGGHRMEKKKGKAYKEANED